MFEADGKLFVEQVFKDGSRSKEQVVEEQSTLGRQFNQAQEAQDLGEGENQK